MLDLYARLADGDRVFAILGKNGRQPAKYSLRKRIKKIFFAASFDRPAVSSNLPQNPQPLNLKSRMVYHRSYLMMSLEKHLLINPAAGLNIIGKPKVSLDQAAAERDLPFFLEMAICLLDQSGHKNSECESDRSNSKLNKLILAIVSPTFRHAGEGRHPARHLRFLDSGLHRNDDWELPPTTIAKSSK